MLSENLQIEVCIGSVEELYAIKDLPIDRIELCSALEIGGITPSVGFIEEAVNLGLETHVLIRSRGGDFVYSSQEIGVMKSDIQLAAELGAKGVVFGLLNAKGEITKKNEDLALLTKSYGLQCTFHRAFEFVTDQKRSLERLVGWKFDRILTSGGNEPKRASELGDLVRLANKKIEIMVGGGVNASNVIKLVETGVDAVHFSVRKWLEEANQGMGRKFSADPNKLTSILDALKRS